MAKAWILFWKDGKKEVVFGDSLSEAYKTKHQHINMSLLISYMEAHVIVKRGTTPTIFYCYKESSNVKLQVIEIISSADCTKFDIMKGKSFNDQLDFDLQYRRLANPDVQTAVKT